MSARQSLGCRILAKLLQGDDRESKGTSYGGKLSDHILSIAKIIDDQCDLTLVRRVRFLTLPDNSSLTSGFYDVKAIADDAQRISA